MFDFWLTAFPLLSPNIVGPCAKKKSKEKISKKNLRPLNCFVFQIAFVVVLNLSRGVYFTREIGEIFRENFDSRPKKICRKNRARCLVRSERDCRFLCENTHTHRVQTTNFEFLTSINGRSFFEVIQEENFSSEPQL